MGLRNIFLTFLRLNCWRSLGCFPESVRPNIPGEVPLTSLWLAHALAARTHLSGDQIYGPTWNCAKNSFIIIIGCIINDIWYIYIYIYICVCAYIYIYIFNMQKKGVGYGSIDGHSYRLSQSISCCITTVADWQSVFYTTSVRMAGIQPSDWSFALRNCLIHSPKINCGSKIWHHYCHWI